MGIETGPSEEQVMKHFPKDFLWGTATAAHQIEGNNTNTDWWVWETRQPKKTKYPLEPSGIGCDSYNKYEEDFELCKQLNNNAVRLSVEWARLEPKEGTFDQKEFDHYKTVLLSARSKGLKTFVTLHHFTNPVWFAKKGGWLSLHAPFFFARYAKKCAQEFGDLVDTFLTINEPQVYALQGCLTGVWPPNKSNPLAALLCQINFMRAHVCAYKEIKGICRTPVGIVKNIAWYESEDILGKLVAKLLFFLNDGVFMGPIVKHMDLIGLNFYFTTVMKGLTKANPNDIVSDLGWWVNPKGLGRVLSALKKYGKPIYITENGVADSTDRIRKVFIHDMLAECLAAISAGVPLHGYFYWSLIDNYEWHQGYWPRFGLVEIDREHNLERKPRASYYYYAQICKANALED